VCDKSSTLNAADDVATSTPVKHDSGGGSTSLQHITIDDSIAESPDLDEDDPENPKTPTSPQDVAGTQRSSLFSKRAGVTPSSTPPVKESHSKKSPPLHEERTKQKGCCVIF